MLNASITASTSPVSPLPAAAPAQQAAAGGGEPGEFARQLERVNAAQAADAAPDTAPRTQQPARAKAKTEAERPKAEKAPAHAAAGPVDDKADSDTATPADDTETAETGAATDAAVLLASLLNRAVPAPVAGRAEAGGSGDAARAAAAAGAAGSKRGADAALAGEATTGGAGASSATERSAAQQERADTGPSLNPVAGDAAAFMLPQAGAQAGAHGAHNIATPDAAAAAPAPYASQVQAPVGSPDFAPGLSAQVSVMVREGLQEARLQLNPAEMGPITVQIQIDGATAQVTMTAEQAPTRDALEQAMPTLAGALREEGLTLTGGGVFEQPRQAHGDDAPATASGRGGRGGADDGADTLAAPARQVAPRGMVDVFA